VSALSGLFQCSNPDLDAELRRAERLLSRAERSIRLLDRLVPENLAAERERLARALLQGRFAEPRFVYAVAPEVEALRPFLTSLASTLPSFGALGQLYAERALELELEAALVGAVGRAEFRALAVERYSPPRVIPAVDSDGLAAAWLGAAEPEIETESFFSDDLSHPSSLVSLLNARIGALRLPVRIELRPLLPTVAAAGDGFVAVRPGVRLSALEAARIAVHELSGHVEPRLAAQREALGIFRVGSRAAGDEEEGRALLLEERAGLLHPARRRDLALRHSAALAVRGGASWFELVRGLETQGVARARALELALRVLRGGGLGREIVYLPSYLQLRAEFAREPSLERYFERGRVSLAAARALRSLERRAAD
jgi:hypothetical protein